MENQCIKMQLHKCSISLNEMISSSKISFVKLKWFQFRGFWINIVVLIGHTLTYGGRNSPHSYQRLQTCKWRILSPAIFHFHILSHGWGFSMYTQIRIVPISMVLIWHMTVLQRPHSFLWIFNIAHHWLLHIFPPTNSILKWISTTMNNFALAFPRW